MPPPLLSDLWSLQTAASQDNSAQGPAGPILTDLTDQQTPLVTTYDVGLAGEIMRRLSKALHVGMRY